MIHLLHCRIRSTALLATLATLGTITPPVNAQERAATRDEVTARDQLAPQDVPFLFRGGSLADFVEALVSDARKHGEPANIVIPPDAALVRVPAVQFVAVNVENSLKAIAEVVSNEWDVDVHVFSRNDGSRPVYTLGVRPQQPRGRDTGATKDAGLRTDVLSIATLTRTVGNEPKDAALPAATILTALESGLGTMGEPEAAIHYHPDSGLVFVRGTAAHLALAREIVAQIENDMMRLRQRALASNDADVARAVQSAPAAGAQSAGAQTTDKQTPTTRSR